MEPVPKTQRMEEFKSSPVPSSVRPSSLHLANSNNHVFNQACSSATIPSLDLDAALKPPPTLHRCTYPSPASAMSPSWAPASISYRPRTTSPLSGSHSRSCSAAGLSLPMSRTQSMPGIGDSGRILYSPQMRPASPSGSPSRVRPPRKPVDEVFPASPVRSSIRDAAESRPRLASVDGSSSPNQTGFTVASLSRHCRPSSPLRGIVLPSASSPSLWPSAPSSLSLPLRPYDVYHCGSLSSVPSTPTSTRSRSPSISSLETIPDSPDAEEAAVEADQLVRLNAAAAADSSDSKGRTSTELPVRGRTMSFGPRDKCKRWSVCGAERRQDLDLETIWED